MVTFEQRLEGEGEEDTQPSGNCVSLAKEELVQRP